MPKTFHHRTDLKTWLNGDKKECSMENITATVTRPTGKTKVIPIYENGNNTYSLGFLPKEAGIHKINVQVQGQHVAGSPYQVTVKDHSKGGPEKVLVYGPGLHEAVANEKAKFEIWTAQAGGGKLAITVEGPSKPDINYVDRKDGSSSVSYVVTEPGQYEVGVKFDEEHVPGSPFNVNATGIGTGPTFPRVQILRGKSEPSKVKTSGNGVISGKVGEECLFKVNCSGAGSNMLVVGIVGPVGPCEDIFVTHNDNRCYNVKYVPKETGEFTVIVKWGEENVPGSPFKVQIS
ncbi:filamin-B-like isoform X1 [Styela clava]